MRYASQYTPLGSRHSRCLLIGVGQSPTEPALTSPWPISNWMGTSSTQAHHFTPALGERLLAIGEYDLVKGSLSDSIATPDQPYPDHHLDQMFPSLGVDLQMVRPRWDQAPQQLTEIWHPEQDTSLTTTEGNKKGQKRDQQPAPRPYLARPEVCSSQHVHVDMDKLAPGHRLFALRSRGNAMPLEDVAHGLITDRIAQVF